MKTVRERWSSMPGWARWIIGAAASAVVGSIATGLGAAILEPKPCFLNQAQAIYIDDYQGSKVFSIATYTRSYGATPVEDASVRYVYTVAVAPEVQDQFGSVIAEHPPDSSSSRCKTREDWNGRDTLTVEFVGCNFEAGEAMDTFTGPYIQKAQRIQSTVTAGDRRWIETVWLSDDDYAWAPRDQSLRSQNEFRGTTWGRLFWLKWLLASRVCLTRL
ncbi:hypothetical protein [Mesorhizobium sp. M0060]|uniref:hypothetical protein n=1 Tax=Mesorhizobium sp. M0060 TaxID=2956866 RepID=UPI00333805E1